MVDIDYTRVIDQGKALKRLQARADEINAAVPVKTFTKIVNGEERIYQRQPKAITSGVKDTARQLIINYVDYFHTILKRIGPPAFEQGPPALQICRHNLASQRTICEKSVYNHIRILEKLGIVKYKFRGSHHAFEIWIDPAVLYQQERIEAAVQPTENVSTYPQPVFTAPDSTANQPQKIATLLPKTANFTALGVTITSKNLETEKEKGGNVHSDALQQEHGDKNYGNPERQQPKSGQTLTVGSESHSDLGTGGGAAGQPANVDNPGDDHQARMERLKTGKRRQNRTLNRSAEQRRAILNGYLASFWRYAQQMLYPGQQFAEYEEPLILSAIRTGVYKDFEPVLTEKEWDQYQTELYKQIDLAAGYYNRHKDKWVPAPYAQFRAGTGYFDRENGRGFIQTRSWLKENQRLYKNNYIAQRISLAIRHLQLHRADKAPQALQRKTYIEAYRLLESQIGKYGEVAQDRFRLLASTIGTAKPKITQGFSRNFNK